MHGGEGKIFVTFEVGIVADPPPGSSGRGQGVGMVKKENRLCYEKGQETGR